MQPNYIESSISKEKCRLTWKSINTITNIDKSLLQKIEGNQMLKAAKLMNECTVFKDRTKIIKKSSVESLKLVWVNLIIYN